MALVSWQRKLLWLTDVSNSCVSGEREEILHRSRDGRFPDHPATFAPVAQREGAGPLAEAAAIGGVFGVVVQSPLEAKCLTLRANTTE